MTDVLDTFLDAPFSSLEVSFARSIARLAGDESRELLLASAATLHAVARGDLCYVLGDDLPEADSSPEDSIDEAPRAAPRALPAKEEWREQLSRSPAVEVAPAYAPPTSARPLVLDAEGRLYLQRSFVAHAAIASAILKRVRASCVVEEDALAEGLARLFAQARPDDLQRAAAELAVRRAFSLITGGPGTGKTTTVAKVLALLVEQAEALGDTPPRIALAAPTGKAAARLAEAIARARGALSVSESVRDALPTHASTLHRLLGLAPGMNRRLSAGRLPHDVVIVDEASMVDLSLMQELLHALSPRARLVLLGDPSQLASVSEGAVFADLCAAPAGSALAQARVRLVEGHRYQSGSALDEFAESIRRGDSERALELLELGPTLTLHDSLPRRGLGDAFLELVERGYADFLAATSPERRLDAFDRFRVLCAHRQGRFGAPEISRRLGAALLERGLMPAARDGRASLEPILIVRNSPALGLFNGDVGYVDRTQLGSSVTHFRREGGGVQTFAPSRLPAHEVAWAMTVHKSQGSEVDSVALVLPDVRSAVCTRELVYTAITRARSRVDVFATSQVLGAAIGHRTVRHGGLREALSRDDDC